MTLLFVVVLSTLTLTFGVRRLEYLRDRPRPLDAGSSWRRATELRQTLETLDYPYQTAPWRRTENARQGRDSLETRP